MSSPLIWTRQPAQNMAAHTGLRGEWDRLNSEGLDLPFLCADALVAALQVFGTGKEQLLVGCRDGRTVAMFVLAPGGPLRWSTFQPSQIPLGAWVAERGQALPVLCRSLLRGPLRMSLVLSITQVDPLIAPRAADEPDTRHGDYIDTAWIDVEGSFEDYWAGRGKNLRQNMRKQRNKLAADGVTTSLHVWHAPEDMRAALGRYGAIESAGWKAADGTAISADNEQGRFYAALFEAAARKGEARVFEYRFNDKPVAINLCLLRKGVLVVLKTTYDESLPKAISPAFLLREEELQLFFGGAEVRRIEYYGKVMEWHTKLTESRRGVYHLTAYRMKLVKRLAGSRARQGIAHAGAAEVSESAPR
jgi:CelD/BcsL family acetyltransferase involved in cellulose biosynthesis